MEVLKITAKDAFTHGRLNMRRGDTCIIEASEARDLEKTGLVAVSPADEGEVEDPAGGKMAPVTENKMEPKAPNKAMPKSLNK